MIIRQFSDHHHHSFISGSFLFIFIVSLLSPYAYFYYLPFIMTCSGIRLGQIRFLYFCFGKETHQNRGQERHHKGNKIQNLVFLYTAPNCLAVERSPQNYIMTGYKSPFFDEWPKLCLIVGINFSLYICIQKCVARRYMCMQCVYAINVIFVFDILFVNGKETIFCSVISVMFIGNESL